MPICQSQIIKRCCSDAACHYGVFEICSINECSDTTTCPMCGAAMKQSPLFEESQTTFPEIEIKEHAPHAR
ncbi:MAG: hypothetical protein AB7E47_11795 [Desulfovibrionaceae bacterium]